MKDKRFIDGTDFNQKLEEKDFNEIFNKKGHQFNENGLLTGCSRCDYCKDALLKIDLPNIDSIEGKKEFQESKKRMLSFLEKHIEKLIEEETNKVKKEIELKIRKDFGLS